MSQPGCVHQTIPAALRDLRAVFTTGVAYVSAIACGYAIIGNHLPNAVHFYSSYTAELSLWAGWSTVFAAYGTILCLNLISLVYERNQRKVQLLWMVVFVNVMTLFSSYACSRGISPVWQDVWGCDFKIVRLVVWMMCTPCMILLIGTISDLRRIQVVAAVLEDVCVFSLAIVAHVTTSMLVSVLAVLTASGMFVHLMYRIWTMVEGAMRHARYEHERRSLASLRFSLLVVWSLFPLVWVLRHVGLFDDRRAETLWQTIDFLSKMVYSSSLLHSNFITVQERQKRALVTVMEGNRVALLELIYPRHVVEAIARHGLGLLGCHNFGTMRTKHDQVTILCADCVGYTSMAKMCEPEAVMQFLHDLYTRFDDLLDMYGVYKLETVGDCYVVVGGLMKVNADGSTYVQRGTGEQHARNVFEFAKAMLRAATVVMPHNGQPVRMRVGIHTGPGVSGVIGKRMPKFVLVGDTMSLAYRMESTSPTGAIHVSQTTCNLINDGSLVPYRAKTKVLGQDERTLATYVYYPPPIDSTDTSESDGCLTPAEET